MHKLAEEAISPFTEPVTAYVKPLKSGNADQQTLAAVV